MEKKLLTGRQLAKILDCDVKTIHHWKRKGIIRPIRQIGHSDVYDEKVVRQLKKYVERYKGDRRYFRICGVIDTNTKVLIELSKWFKGG